MKKFPRRRPPPKTRPDPNKAWGTKDARNMGRLADDMLAEAFADDPEAAKRALGPELLGELERLGVLTGGALLEERVPEDLTLAPVVVRVWDVLHLADVARKGAAS